MISWFMSSPADKGEDKFYQYEDRVFKVFYGDF